VPEAFYEPDGEQLRATELSRGPWDPAMQHAGPLAALLGRAIEQLPDSTGFEVGRITLEILGPVPIGPVEVEARILRPGRRVQLVEAELGAAGQTLIRARAWRLRIDQLDLPQEAIVALPPPEAPEHGSVPEFFPTEQAHGYHTGMELRAISGSFLEPGPATMWLRMRQPLVAGEEPTPLQRLLIVADVGNGISASLDYSRFVFINVDLTVQIERLPEGEWIGIDAVTLPQPSGRGTAESVLFDRSGRVGRALQTLLIFER
jgi:Thioesterase-like superfamily